jgi:hypothetical protein
LTEARTEPVLAGTGSVRVCPQLFDQVPLSRAAGPSPGQHRGQAWSRRTPATGSKVSQPIRPRRPAAAAHSSKLPIAGWRASSTRLRSPVLICTALCEAGLCRHAARQAGVRPGRTVRSPSTSRTARRALESSGSHAVCSRRRALWNFSSCAE